MNKIRIAQAQMRVDGKLEELEGRLRNIMERAKEKAADMVLLPEMFCCPYDCGIFAEYAEPEGGKLWTLCSDMAGEYGIYLSAGSVPERGADGKIYNTAYVFDRFGIQIAKHRKMHLFDVDIDGKENDGGVSFRESDSISAGNRITTFDTEFGRGGICICYDFRFPEMGRIMALEDARFIIVPACFNMTTGPLHWELMFRSQAVNNQVFTIGTAAARDKDADYVSWGHSIVCDPWGRVMHQMGEDEGIHIMDIDLSDVRDVREELPLLNHRREDIYSVEITR